MIVFLGSIASHFSALQPADSAGLARHPFFHRVGSGWP